jgi:hypothetical protein
MYYSVGLWGWGRENSASDNVVLHTIRAMPLKRNKTVEVEIVIDFLNVAKGFYISPVVNVFCDRLRAIIYYLYVVNLRSWSHIHIQT